MKLTLVSFTVHGKTYSKFLMLDATKPKFDFESNFSSFGINVPRGTTFSVG